MGIGDLQLGQDKGFQQIDLVAAVNIPAQAFDLILIGVVHTSFSGKCSDRYKFRGLRG